MSVLLLAEHQQGRLRSSVASVVNAARALQEDIHVLIVAGEEEAMALAEQASAIDGVNQVLTISAPHLEVMMTEDVVAQLRVVLRRNAYTYFMMASSYAGKRIVSYLAGQLDVDVSSDIIAFVDKNNYLRPIYSGSLQAVETLKGKPRLMSVRANAFAPAPVQGLPTPVVTLAAQPPVGRVKLLQRLISATPGRTDLARARIVLGVGVGVQKSLWPLVEQLAEKLGAAIGASRAAVESGLASSSCMLGQTGKIVSPELYIAIGISGAVQHLAGVKDSACIVAINNDPNAAIFQNVDYGLVGDAGEVLTQMLAFV